MRSENEPPGQKRRSVIEDVRRAQIIRGAVETFAEVGYGSTSLARIAERVGISKGVISYHFAGKDELVDQLVSTIYREMVEFVVPRVAPETTATGKLRSRIRAVAEYVDGNRAQLLALAEIFSNARGADGRLLYGHAFNEDLYRSQEEIFRAGQEAGEFRQFDTRVMAVSLEAAIDAMVSYLGEYPDHDIAAHAEQLADLFEQAVRADSGAGRTAR
ncbi:TetR/AcrR family transcriptional regulator [Actinoalloteichus hymeniacidonis]|uniref:Transcriptional regulator, TetR family n=1 Tax=Actinoalloteichus hymeniacidonis TaxID=340345 RepID=A0AAC9HRE4_9PSEU|nr:TetR/AcrR family transcriptional regulator [Actinoalloteichus hymeniacidonis]AOS63953.1 transcriptional regulator, TetR family [Actinoalloteichus hymeniacidonis]MBB5907990.1 AcrR family transcriptional regulator [Actinoalloteichus hymeniacidonis]